MTNVLVAGAVQDTFGSPDELGDVVITADVTGDLSRLSSLYVVVEDPDALFQPNPSLFYRADGRDNQLRISPRPLAGRTGTFTGPLRVNLCTDATCTTALRGSPVIVPYSFQVLRGMTITSGGPATFAADFAQPVPAPWSLEVGLPDGATTYEANLLDNTPETPRWMTLRTAGNTVTLAPEQAPVVSKRYTLSVTSTARTRDGRTRTYSQSLAVTYDVRSTGVPYIFNPESLSFTVSSGASSGWQRFETLMASDDVIDTVQSIVFDTLPWLTHRTVVEPGRQGVIEFLASSCYTTLPPPGTPPCLAPGRYTARVGLRTRAGSLVSRELEVVLNVTP